MAVPHDYRVNSAREGDAGISAEICEAVECELVKSDVLDTGPTSALV
jgi:hypothetical protein